MWVLWEVLHADDAGIVIHQEACSRRRRFIVTA